MNEKRDYRGRQVLVEGWSGGVVVHLALYPVVLWVLDQEDYCLGSV